MVLFHNLQISAVVQLPSKKLCIFPYCYDCKVTWRYVWQKCTFRNHCSESHRSLFAAVFIVVIVSVLEKCSTECFVVVSI
jgi:hypothetical protein